MLAFRLDLDVVGSAAWRSGLERRSYDDHRRMAEGSTPTQLLLRPLIRCFSIIISALWQLLSEFGFVVAYSQPLLRFLATAG